MGERGDRTASAGGMEHDRASLTEATEGHKHGQQTHEPSHLCLPGHADLRAVLGSPPEAVSERAQGATGSPKGHLAGQVQARRVPLPVHAPSALVPANTDQKEFTAGARGCGRIPGSSARGPGRR